MVTALLVLFVVCKVLVLKSMAAPPPSIVIALLPESTVVPDVILIPPVAPPVKEIVPVLAVKLWPTVNPVDPTKIIFPELVVIEFAVASVPPLLSKSILPVPVLNA